MKTKQTSKPPASPGPYHDKAEIINALNALSQSDIRRLVDVGFFRILVPSGRGNQAEAEDLLNDAVVRTLRFKRKWKRGISFPNHLLACMRSIANGRFRRARRYVELSLELADPSPVNLEAVVAATASADQLREKLRGDAIALKVLETMLDGCSPREALKRLQMKSNVYVAARKRIFRLARKLWRSSEKGSGT